MNIGTETFQTELLIHADPKEVHKVFLERVWWGGGMPTVFKVFGPLAATYQIQPSKDESGAGGIRQVAFGILEHIEEGEFGKYIEYTLKRKSVFQASHHRGRVDFHQAGEGCTRVVWTINYSPYFYSRHYLQLFFAIIENIFMPVLKYTCEKGRKQQSGSFFGFIFKILLFAYLGFMISRLSRLPSIKPHAPGKDYLDVCDKYRHSTPDLTQFVQETSFLVIGGTGFTGSAIVEDLRKRGAKKIRVLSRSYPPNVEYPYGVGKQYYYPLKGVEYVKGDMSDYKSLQEATKGIDVVFHTAVIQGYPAFGQLRAGDLTEKANVGGIKNTYRASVESKSVKSIIYTSSCDTVFTLRHYFNATEVQPYASFGNTKDRHATGEFAVGDHYARTKIMAEKFLMEMDNKDGIRTVSIRPNGIYGPGENYAFRGAVDPAFILGIIPFYFADDQRSDLTCVYNLVSAHILAAYKLSKDPNTVGGKEYFITDEFVINTFQAMVPVIESIGAPVKKWLAIPSIVIAKTAYLLEVIEKFSHETFGWGPTPFLTEKMAYKTIYSHTHDNTRARKDLGYKPIMSTQQCLKYSAEEVARRYFE